MPKEFRQNRPWYRLIQFLTRQFFRIGFGMKVTGLENIPRTGPVIIAPVHCSYLDPPLVGCLVPRFMRFMAKEELFKGFVGWAITSLGTFPVARGTGDTGALRIARATLEGGGTLLIFPEGTRNDGQTLNPLQPGVLLLADKSQAQIVPVGIAGTDKAMPRGGKMKRHPLHVHFAEPFRVADIGVTGKALREAFNRELAERLVAATHTAGLELKTPAGLPTPASTDRS